jgi:hypothetical protein
MTDQPLARMLRLYRTTAQPPLTIRQLAPQMGTSAATLLRLEQGKPCDVETWLRVQDWLLGRTR